MMIFLEILLVLIVLISLFFFIRINSNNNRHDNELFGIGALITCSDGRNYPLSYTEVLVGKARNADIEIDLPGLSGEIRKNTLATLADYHIKLSYVSPAMWEITDISLPEHVCVTLKDKNGSTLLKKGTSYSIYDGGQFSVGDVSFTINLR